MEVPGEIVDMMMVYMEMVNMERLDMETGEVGHRGAGDCAC